MLIVGILGTLALVAIIGALIGPTRKIRAIKRDLEAAIDQYQRETRDYVDKRIDESYLTAEERKELGLPMPTITIEDNRTTSILEPKYPLDHPANIPSCGGKHDWSELWWEPPLQPTNLNTYGKSERRTRRCLTCSRRNIYIYRNLAWEWIDD